MCKCVDIFGGWWMRTPLYEFSFPCNCFGMGYIFFFSLFFFDTLCGCVAYLLWVCIFSLFFDMPCGHVAYLFWVCIFYFFLYSPYIMMITLERDKHAHLGVLFLDGWEMYLLSSRCRSIACEWTCTWSWSWVYEVILTKAHNNLTKLNEKTSCICRKGFSNL